ncbi:MAG: PQQ-binding-like beta-propeller repeat protein [Phycisphaerales bacterium]
MRRGLDIKAIFAASAAMFSVVGPSSSAHAQFVGGMPEDDQVIIAYPDDSVLARESLARLQELAAAQVWGEAVRNVQSLLDTEGDRMIEAEGETDLMLPVRARVHEVLLTQPALLERYRAAQSVAAEELLKRGDLETVERSYLLTPAGLTAALRLAQANIEHARFHAAARILESLDRHPDRLASATDAEASARVAALLARYLRDDRTLQLATRFAGDAQRLGKVVEIPDRATVLPELPRSVTVYGSQAAVDVSRVSPEPLEAVSLASNAPAFDAIPESDPWRRSIVLPVVVGNVVYVNDGETFKALDRETLAVRWETRPEWGGPKSNSMDNIYRSFRDTIEDPATVAFSGTARGGVVVGTTGFARGGFRSGDPRVHALDAATGRVLWSVDAAWLDPSLNTGSVRGPAVIDGDTVVVALSKSASVSTRVGSLYMVGLDLYSGEMRWMRLLGSTGLLPWGGAARRADASVVHEGVVYRADDFGLIGAYETTNGRPLWVRRMNAKRPRRTMMAQRVAADPAFSAVVPVIVGGDLFILEPGDAKVLRIDARTGERSGARDASAFNSPVYLLSCGSTLIGVGRSRLAFVDTSDFVNGTIRLSPSIGDPQTSVRDQTILGRVVAAGSRVLVPIASGFSLVDPQDPASVEGVAMEGSGNTICVGGQVIAADSASLRTYAPWERARESLLARIASAPDDATLTMTFVQLAHRAGHTDEIGEMLDRTLARIEPWSADSTGVRSRLFTLLHGIVRDLREAALPAETGAAHPARRASASIETIERVESAMSRCAETSAQRATMFMEIGHLHEARQEDQRALRAYQEIFADAQMSSVVPLPPPMEPGETLDAAGEMERTARDTRSQALSRTEEILRRRGIVDYKAFDLEASAMLALGAEADERTLEDVARRYPFATSSIEAWRSVGRIRGERGDAGGSSRALASGVRTARARAAAGDADVHGVLVQDTLALVSALEGMGRTSEAYRTLRGVVEWTTPEQEAPIRSRLGELRATLELTSGRATIGMSIDPAGEPQVLTGWEVMEPLTPAGPGTPTDVVMMQSPATRRVALFGIDATTGRLGEIWTRPFESLPPSTLAVNLDRTYLFWSSADSGLVEAIDNATGKTSWRSPAFGAVFGPDQPARFPATTQLQTPASGDVRFGDLVVALDDQTVILVERGGRAAAFDAERGEVLWKRLLDMQQVFDVAGGGTQVMIAGATVVSAERVRRPDDTSLVPLILVLDKRTGTTTLSFGGSNAEQTRELGQYVRWVRATRDARFVVGVNDAMLLIEPGQSDPVWVTRPLGLVVPALAAIGNGNVVVLDDTRTPWVYSLTDGSPAPGRVDPGGNGLTYPLRLARVASGVVIGSTGGFMTIDATGTLIGADGLPRDTFALPPVVGENAVVGVSALERRSPQATGGEVVTVYVMEPSTGRVVDRRQVELAGEPRSVAMVDGHVVLSIDNASVVLGTRP